MQDIKLVIDSNGRYNLNIVDGDFEGEAGFDTALEVSILTDARADSSQVQIPENRRGWVGNTVSPVENRQLGGLWWLIDQRRLTQSTVNDGVDYVRGSLQWLIDDRIVNNINVTGKIVPTLGISIRVDITALNGLIETRYFKSWEVTGGN